MYLSTSEYHTEVGWVTVYREGAPIIRLKRLGINVKQKEPGSHRLGLHQPVIVSWISNKEPSRDGVNILKTSVVEPVGFWIRTSKYKNEYEINLDQAGRILEANFFRTLHDMGIRIEYGTPHEDHRQGVDFWVLLFDEMNGMWRWYPINVTLNPVHAKLPGRVLRISFQHEYPNRHELVRTLKVNGDYELARIASSRKTPLTRQEALQKEISYTGDKAKQRIRSAFIKA